MKLRIAAAVVFCAPLCAPLFAWGQIKSCDDLKAEIAKKIDAKGVTGYTLTIVDKGKDTEGKVVGSCGGGTKNVVYKRAAAVPEPAAKPAAKPKAASESEPK